MLENDRPKYEQFYKNYGRQLRYGAVANYGQNIESLRDLLIYNVSEDKTATLKEYTDAHACRAEVHILRRGRERAQAYCSLPQAELVRSKGYEILCMTEEVDEYIVEQLGELCGQEVLQHSRPATSASRPRKRRRPTWKSVRPT